MLVAKHLSGIPPARLVLRSEPAARVPMSCASPSREAATAIFAGAVAWARYFIAAICGRAAGLPVGLAGTRHGHGHRRSAEADLQLLRARTAQAHGRFIGARSHLAWL